VTVGVTGHWLIGYSRRLLGIAVRGRVIAAAALVLLPLAAEPA